MILFALITANKITLSYLPYVYSYGGQLSTYMRFKYPFIVDGAIAASSPIFQVAGIVPGELFWNGVTAVRKYWYGRCVLIILVAIIGL